MSKLTLKVLESKFQQSHPFGTIIKQTKNKYDVYFDSRDFRSETEKEMDQWGTTADKRKLYSYNASNLIELALKLKVDVSEYEETKISKVNQEWELWLKEAPEVDDLFAE